MSKGNAKRKPRPIRSESLSLALLIDILISHPFLALVTRGLATTMHVYEKHGPGYTTSGWLKLSQEQLLPAKLQIIFRLP